MVAPDSDLKTFTVITLGCKANQYDGQLMREHIAALGYDQVESSSNSVDLCVINTCAVTRSSEAQSRRVVKRAIRENPGARIIVTGCCAELSPESYEKIPGVSMVLGNARKEEIADILAGWRISSSPGITGFLGHTRAFIKIQDGCGSACGYCIVPRLRGAPRSRDEAGIVLEARALSGNGYGEIVLCGIHLGHYGRDRGAALALPGLISRLEKIEGLRRIRLSSIEPEDVDDALIDLMAAAGKLCPHLHLPLQSGDAAVLKAMRRRYGPDDYAGLVQKIRRRIPDVSITTDVMVGFPCESRTAFENTVALVRSALFSRVHIFPYSPRPGAAAWSMGDPVTPAEKKERSSELAAVAAEASRSYRRRFVGKDVEVLVEEESGREGGVNRGLSGEYIRVVFRGRGAVRGNLCRVRVSGVRGEGLEGYSHPVPGK